MSNYVKNKVNISGKKADINKFINEVFDGDVKNDFDFNKLIPMPNTLQIISGTASTKALTLALYEKYGYGRLPDDESLQNAMDSLYKYGQLKPKKCLSVKEVENAKNGFPDIPSEGNKSYLFTEGFGGNLKGPKCLEDALYLGNVMLKNIELYGTKDWYDWSIKNWGTKWNAGDTSCIRETKSKLLFQFTTAWNCPHGLIVKMVKKYPELRFVIKYSDEDLGGSNHGEWSGVNGKVIENACSRRKMTFIYKNLWG